MGKKQNIKGERGLTLAQAKRLRSGDWIHHRFDTQSKGPLRVRVTSVKTWVTRPDEVLIGVKWGIYQHGYLNEYNLKDWALGDGV